MKMNTKVRYGLRAMLAINKHTTSSGILQKEISAAEDIPIKYLDTIISGLRNAGLIMNFSGKRSGYVLSKDEHDISVYDVYRAFEPEIALANCSCPKCAQNNECLTKNYWLNLNHQIEGLMKSSTLDQLTLNNETIKN